MKFSYTFLLAFSSSLLFVAPIALDMGFGYIAFAIICFLLALSAVVGYFVLLIKGKKGFGSWSFPIVLIILFCVYFLNFSALKCQYVLYKYREEMEELVKLSKDWKEQTLYTFEYAADDVGEYEIELKGKLKKSNIANSPLAHIWAFEIPRTGYSCFIIGNAN
jgi:hypothetical protein